MEKLQRQLRKICFFNNSNKISGFDQIHLKFNGDQMQYIDQTFPILINSIRNNNPNIPLSSLISLLTDFISQNFPDGAFSPTYIPELIPSEHISDKIWQNQTHVYEPQNIYLKNAIFSKTFTSASRKVFDGKFQFFLSQESLEQGGKKHNRYFFLVPDSIKLDFNDSSLNCKLKFEFRVPTTEERAENKRLTQLIIINKAIGKIFDSIQSEFKTTSFKTVLKDLLSEYTQKLIPGRFIVPNFQSEIDKCWKKFTHDLLIPFLLEFLEVDSPISSIQNIISTIQKAFWPIWVYIANIQRIWVAINRKKKFVFDVNYGTTSDRIPKTYYPELEKNTSLQNFWCDLFKNFPKSNLITSGKWNGFLSEHPYAVVDFSLLSSHLRSAIMEDMTLNKPLCELIDGFLIKSDNSQALRLLESQFKGKVQTIYIDPPYNTGATDFVYHDKFLSSNWLGLMNSSLSAAKKILSLDGILFSSIDDNELAPYSLLLEDIFPKRLETIVWHKKTQPSFLSKELISVTEYILSAKMTKNSIKLMGGYGNPDKLTELINIGNHICDRKIPKNSVIIANGWSGTLKSGIYGRDKLQVQLLNGPIYVDKGHPDHDLILKSRFKWIQDRINEELGKGGMIHIKSIHSLRPTIARKYSSPIVKAPTTLLSKKINAIATNTDANAELKNLFQISPFDYSKPTKLIQYLLRAGTYYSPDCWVMDFFAGSGTTAQATMQLNRDEGGNRKYLLIESSSYFETVVIPRIQKLMYSQTWKAGMPINLQGYSHFYKSLKLEQTSDCYWNLENSILNFSTSSKLNSNAKELNNFKNESKEHHLLKYIIDPAENDFPVRLNIEEFSNPFSYYLIVEDKGVICEKNVDLVETFNLMFGITVQRQYFRYNLNSKYVVILGTRKSKENLKENIIIVWRNLDSIDKHRDVSFIMGDILADIPKDLEYKFYINGSTEHLKDFLQVNSIETEFLNLMFLTD